MWTCHCNFCMLSIICFNFNTKRQIWLFELTFYENLLLVCNKPYPPKLLLQLENDNFKHLIYVSTWGMPWPRLRAHTSMPRPWLNDHSGLPCLGGMPWHWLVGMTSKKCMSLQPCQPRKNIYFVSYFTTIIFLNWCPIGNKINKSYCALA